MPAEARISSIWKKQKLFIAVAMMVLGGWFFLDGFRTWPRSNERWLAHQQHKNEDRLNDWPAYAKSRGWIPEPPEKFYTPEDIRGQYQYGGLCVLAGIIIFVYWATQIPRTVRTDEEAVYTSAGKRVPFDAITGVDKKKWDAKGIARVSYELEGETGKFTVDDYKFETEPTRRILDEIESHLQQRDRSPESQGID
ncbi:MAG: hypothetical protein M3463_15610 [Verrucomicrobiota bacterium]|nr:hypothetical protein [Verrucomicrobiota bacterium]